MSGGPLYENWIVDDHMIQIGKVLKALNDAEMDQVTNSIPTGYTIQFHPSETGLEVSAGDETDWDGRKLLGRLTPIDCPGAWSFIPEKRKVWWSTRRNAWATRAERAADRKDEERERKEQEKANASSTT